MSINMSTITKMEYRLAYAMMVEKKATLAASGTIKAGHEIRGSVTDMVRLYLEAPSETVMLLMMDGMDQFMRTSGITKNTALAKDDLWDIESSSREPAAAIIKIDPNDIQGQKLLANVRTKLQSEGDWRMARWLLGKETSDRFDKLRDQIRGQDQAASHQKISDFVDGWTSMCDVMGNKPTALQFTTMVTRHLILRQ